MSSKPRIVMMTDFGLGNLGAATMEGVCVSVDPELVCTQLTHAIAPFNTWQASAALLYTLPFWPSGTVFVSVVDPGVGTARRACVAKLKNGSYVVTPDNGTLTHLYYRIGVEAVRVIDETVNRLHGTEETSIFHGRDLFAYTAARLAAGIIDFAGVGPAYPVEEIVLHDRLYNPQLQPGRAEGCITSAGRQFGNLDTNIPVDGFARCGFALGDTPQVTVTHEGKTCFSARVPYQRSFGYTGPGEPILYNGSTLYIGLALNQANFAQKYGIEDGESWKVSITS